MRPKHFLVLLILALMLVVPRLVMAAPLVHDFHCDECHIPGWTVNDLENGNVCLRCHGVPTKPKYMARDPFAISDGGFTVGDASNVFNNNPAHASETSHHWASSSTNSVAGATEPVKATYPGLFGRSGSTSGKLVCSRCHQLHGTTDNPTLMPQSGARLTDPPLSPNSLCLACHTKFAQMGTTPNNHGLISHPIGMNYMATVGADPNYNSGTFSGEIALMDDGTISCLTCHGVHATDSDADTADGFTVDGFGTTAIGAGDGLMLRHNGPGREDPANDASICQACHEYKGHGMSGANQMGCMVCHGGHEYDATGYNNLFMLRKQVDLDYVPKLNGAGTVDLMYTSLDRPWQDGGTGFCESCHDLPLSVAEHNTGAPQDAAFCTGCHKHETDSGSFGGACNSCHGYAPNDNVPGGSDGYAYIDATHDYSQDANSKNELQTAHANHAGVGAGRYSFPCQECHSNFVASPHPALDNNYQDVAFAGGLAETGLTPLAYDKTGNGSCDTIYCHSNGRVRGASPTAATIPDWAAGAGGGRDAITGCVSCHNIPANGLSNPTSNSPAHMVHMAQGYTCDFCHNATASGNTTLTATAIGGTHVDGTANVVVDPANILTSSSAPAGEEFNTTNATCAIYCHSDGRGNTVQAPVWTIATTGDCGDCHGNPPADATDGGSHAKHVTDLGLGCTVCHSDNSDLGTARVHIDGVIDADFTVCNACHGSTSGNTTVDDPDRIPTWGDSTSVDCETCHSGSAIATINSNGGAGTYVDQSEFATGHGMAAVAVACTSCHDAAAAGHFDGNTDPRLKVDPMGDGGSIDYSSTATAWCQDCHGTIVTHYAATGTECASCHEPHGKGMATLGNTDAMLIVGKNFTDKTARDSYVKSGFDGVCQSCHGGTTLYFNTTTFDNTHNYGIAPGKVCTECHKHDATPAFSASCTDCHGSAAGNFWPDDTDKGSGTGVYPNRLGSHETHINKIALQNFGVGATLADKNATCNWCHPGGGHSGDQASAPADLMDGTTTFFKDIVGDQNVQVSVVTQSADLKVSCATVDCHYSNAVPEDDWYATGTQDNCLYCHEYTNGGQPSYAQDSLPNAHNKHMGDSDRNMVCDDCHANPAGAKDHQNGVVDFSTSVVAPNTSSLFAAINTDGTPGSDSGPKYGTSSTASEFSSCGNLYCHGNFTGGNAASPNWYETAALGNDGACGTCHGSDTSATPVTNKHGVHLGSDTYVPNNCDDCHTLDVATHVYGTVDLGGNASVASAPSCTNDCHTLDGLDNNAAATADNPAWDSSNELGCEDCHVSGLSWTGTAGAALTRGLPPIGDRHDEHVANAYIASDCNVCHSSNAAIHSVMNNVVEVDGSKINMFSTPSCTNDCHSLMGANNVDNSGAADDTSWTNVNPLGCADCHDNTLAGLQPLNTMEPTSGLHDTTSALNHTTLLGATSCTECHTTTPSASHMNTVWVNAATLGDFNFEATNIASYSHTIGCAASCHQDKGEWNREWWNVVDAIPQNTDSPGDAVCGNCHGDFGGWRFTAAATNTGHTNPYDQGGGNLDKMDQHDGCTTCHGWGSAPAVYNSAMSPSRGGANPGYFGHMDGRITLNGPDESLTIDSIAYTAQGAQYDDNTGGCAAACHSINFAMNSNSNWISNYVDAGSGACDTCHATNGVTHGNASENLTVHTAHNANVLIDTNTNFDSATISTWDNCDTCHPHSGAFDAGNKHNDGTVNFANMITATTYDYAKGASFGGSCGATNGCHDSDSGEWQSGDLSSGGDNGCADCHASAAGFFTEPNGWPQVQGMHDSHVGNTAYVADNCVDCHNDNTTTHSTINNVVTAVGGAKLATFTAPNCANDCHNVDASGDGWLAGALECVDCHVNDASKDFIGDNSGANLPASGLHAAATALAHDDSFGTGGTCTSCHDSAAPSNAHIAGGNAQNSTQATFTFATGVTYDNTNFATSNTGCAAACHADADANSGAGKWYRKWLGVTDAKPLASNNPGDAVCDNCHNDGITAGTSTVDNSWNGGMSPGHGNVDGDGSTEMINQHAQCKTCHGWDGIGSNYDETWGNDHGDGNISMNGPAAPATGAEYDEATWGCNMACHQGAANVDHFMNDSTWPITYGNFGSGDCDACHTSLGATHGSSNESAVMHTAHATSNYVTGCTDCHTHDGISSSPDGSGDHYNGTVNFTDSGKLGTSASTDLDYDENAGNFATNCTNTCHAVDNISEWAAQSLLNGDANACVDCHDADVEGGVTAGTMLLDQGGYLPTSNNHTLHLNATASLVNDCNDCHGASANTGGHTGHKQNDGIDLGGEITAGSDSCTNNCHTLNGLDGVAGTDVAWTTTEQLGCSDCHDISATSALNAPQHANLSATQGPATGLHSKHMAADTDYVADCAACHTHNGALSDGSNGHVDAVNPTLVGTMDYDIGNVGATNCTNACHLAADNGDWSATGALACIDCHDATGKTLNAGGSFNGSNQATTGRHAAHLDSAYAYGCADCHGHSGVLTDATHVNGPAVTNITMAGEVTVSPIPANDTCTNNCHTVTDGADWTAGTPTNGIILACDECHGSGKSLDQGPIAPTSGEHTPHLTSNSLTGTEANGEDCYACHESSITSAGALKNYRANAANKHLDTLATSVVFNSTFNYEGNAAGITSTGDAATCSNILCHNGVTTPTWATAGSIACGQCHNTSGTGPLPSGASTAGSHNAHANNDSTYTDCANCHENVADYTATGGTNHQNLSVEVVPFDGSSNAGTYTDADNAGGINWATGGSDNGTCANSCHGVAASPYWGNTGSVGCTTCHNDGSAGTAIVNAVPTATAGVHAAHNDAYNGYVPSDCVACHGAGSDSTGYAANVNHINGALGSGATYNSTTITSYDFATTQTCVNSCHNVTDGRDWTDAPTGLACDDCHGATTKSLYRNRVGGSHAAHYNTSSTPVAGDINRTGNNDTADYNFGCAECHAGSHIDGSLVMNGAASFNTGDSTCGTNACHEDGLGGTPATTPTWGTPFSGETCDDCHGNSPTTNAHQVHAVGIHFGDLYNRTDGGLLTTNSGDSTLGEVDHGDGNSTTISCNVCHNDTVTTGRNRLGSECMSCHGTDTDNAANNIAIADHQVHVNGTTNVAFLGTIKSKAQLRDNLADADANGGTNLLSEIWNRLTGYKSATNSADTSLITADAWEIAGSNTCSNIACHNGNNAVWEAPQNDCMACHKSLPK